MKQVKDLCVCLVVVIGILLCMSSCQHVRQSTKEIDMYHQLHDVRVADKNDENICHLDTAIINLVNYYEHDGSKLKLAEAYYCAGRIFYERKEASTALRYFQLAEEALPESDDPTLGNVIFSQMGYIFSHQDLHDEAISAFRKSLAVANHRSDTLMMIYAYRDIAVECRKARNLKESEYYFRKALALSLKKEDWSYMYYGIKGQLAGLYYVAGDYGKALHEMRSSIAKTRPNDQSGTYTIASKIYLAVGMVDSAEYCAKKVLGIGTLYAKWSANERLAEIAVRRGLPELALAYLSEYKRLNDSITAITNTENVAKIHAMYNYQKQERENQILREENRRKNMYLAFAVMVSIVLGIACVSGVLLYRKHLHTRWLKGELLGDVERRLKAMEEQMRQERVEQELRRKEVCRRFLGVTEEDSPLIDKDWEQLEQTVNDVCPRFSERLRGMCRLNDYELRVCLLRKIGMTPTRIAALLIKSKQAVNSTRERLYMRAFGRKGTPSQWDDYLKTL